MNQSMFYKTLKNKFIEVVKQNNLLEENILIEAKALEPTEAIGKTVRQDFPILTGKDRMIQATCKGVIGQAFTDAPSYFTGTLKDVYQLDLDADSHNRGIFIAAMNAVMGYLKKSHSTVHCKNDGPEQCAMHILKYIQTNYEKPKIALIGYQPSILEALSKHFSLRVVDLNEKNIGEIRYSVLVEDGRNEKIWKSMCEEADLIVCTGSTVCNGTIVNYLPWKNKILFYGTTLAGAATLMDLPRICFAEEVSK